MSSGHAMDLAGIRAFGPSGNAAQDHARESERLRKAADGFEEMFLQQILKAGRAGSLGEDLMGGAAVENTRAMLDSALARGMAGSARLGIADAVFRQFAPAAGLGEDKP
ncbi:flagellar protein FlgJ [Rhodovulum bhavnagarense]|uniref:Flagellar protein FlgJ n=1 Tax=Rhodovulum bhavnagarense TaxID=992286 RepID=A0A4R2RFD1_9RHOB|nr:rod-binding protein [Rhodovulum bhavnagarense]TCP61344.1 flagellar protein FlgJ [Rhodovulum bhavnagarense]